MSAQLSRCVAVCSRHFVASRINAPAVVVAVVFTLDHFVTTQRTMGRTKSLLDHLHASTKRAAALEQHCVCVCVCCIVRSHGPVTAARRAATVTAPSVLCDHRSAPDTWLC